MMKHQPSKTIKNHQKPSKYGWFITVSIGL